MIFSAPATSQRKRRGVRLEKYGVEIEAAEFGIGIGVIGVDLVIALQAPASNRQASWNRGGTAVIEPAAS